LAARAHLGRLQCRLDHAGNAYRHLVLQVEHLQAIFAQGSPWRATGPRPGRRAISLLFEWKPINGVASLSLLSLRLHLGQQLDGRRTVIIHQTLDTIRVFYHSAEEQYRNTFHTARHAMFFSFPEDARWNPDRQVVEFGVGIGEYEGVVRIPRALFRRFIDGAVTPERCVEAYHLQRTHFERIVERRLRRRQLTDDGNVEITGRDLWEREVAGSARARVTAFRQSA